MACLLTQGNILSCNEGFGGIKEIYLANKEGITATAALGVVTAFVKTTGKRFYKYSLTPFTANADFELATSRENGTQECKQTIGFIINKLTSSLRNELVNVSKANILAVVVDNNDNAWLFGNDFGLYTPTVKGASGKALKDRNGYEVALEGMEKEPPLSVTAALLSALETPGT